MMKRLFAAAFATAILTVAVAPIANAQDKALAAQQQKRKDCAAKWNSEKARADAKGREAYRAFMTACVRS